MAQTRQQDNSTGRRPDRPAGESGYDGDDPVTRRRVEDRGTGTVDPLRHDVEPRHTGDLDLPPAPAMGAGALADPALAADPYPPTIPPGMPVADEEELPTPEMVAAESRAASMLADAEPRGRSPAALILAIVAVIVALVLIWSAIA